MSDGPKRIALKWEPGKAVTSGLLMHHKAYTRYIREDEVERRIEELEAENAKLKKELCEYACQNTYDMNDIVDLGMVRDQQSARIEELEAAFANISREYDARGDHIEELKAKLAECEVRLSRAMSALDVYADPCDATETTPCGYEGHMCCMTARAILALMEGEDDE